MNKLIGLLSGGLALACAGSLNAATIDIVDSSGAVYGAIEFDEEFVGDIQGWFVDDWSDDLAERYAMGNNSNPETESDFVELVTGEEVDLMAAYEEVESFSITGAAFFTAKFGQSLAIFQVLTTDTVDITWIAVEGNSCPGDFPGHANQCGGLSHVYSTSTIPVPASLPLMLLGLAGLGIMHRRRRS